MVGSRSQGMEMNLFYWERSLCADESPHTIKRAWSGANIDEYTTCSIFALDYSQSSTWSIVQSLLPGPLPMQVE